ncbi:hypothetical protein G6F68_021807 [Rhizopus microsporus]|nr:hypothetical protein G6F68_021807 [Rhizopus microsporus]KAG1364673.1 hypothetical protein G6F59_018944 [Rhizopus arrhizus]
MASRRTPQCRVSEAITHPSFNRSGPIDWPFISRNVSQRTSAADLLIAGIPAAYCGPSCPCSPLQLPKTWNLTIAPPHVAVG